jgi:hypothetical protein
MRLKSCALACVGALIAQAGAAAAPAGFWTLGKTMQRLDGMRVRVGQRLIRLETPTLLCSGVGRAFRQDGVRRWQRFHCTYVVFIHGRTYDCEFRAVVVRGQRLSLRAPRWIGAAP